MPDRMWYYSSGGEQQGPVSTSRLRELATSGELQPDNLVWSEGMPNWAAASSIKGLLPSAVTTSAAVVTPVAPATADQVTSATHVQPAGGQYTQQMSAATQMAGAAARQAVGAFRSLVSDPVGGIGQSFHQLSRTAALQVGIAFLVLFLLLAILASVIGTASVGGLALISGESATAFLQGLLVLLVFLGAMIGVSALFRTMTRATVGLEADLFIVGASLLPIGFYFLLSSVLNVQSRIVMAIVTIAAVFAMTFTTLMLHSGLTRIVRLTDRLASLAVPAMFVAGGAASWIIMRLFNR
jgi:hypothetical protein